MLAIFKREFKSYFATPIGFIILAAYYFFLGYYFTLLFSFGSPYINELIGAMSVLVVFTIPAITMRLLSEERRQKTDQILLTSPVKLWSIVMGKFLAALSIHAIGFVPTIIYQIIVSTYVSIGIFSYIYSLIGVLLLGAALIAIGMFISSLTESPVISIVITLIVDIFLLSIGSLSSAIPIPDAGTGFFSKAISFIAQKFVDLLNSLDFVSVLDSFNEQVFSVADIIYFVSIIAAFLFLSVRSLEKRRWS